MAAKVIYKPIYQYKYLQIIWLYLSNSPGTSSASKHVHVAPGVPHVGAETARTGPLQATLRSTPVPPEH